MRRQEPTYIIKSAMWNATYYMHHYLIDYIDVVILQIHELH